MGLSGPGLSGTGPGSLLTYKLKCNSVFLLQNIENIRVLPGVKYLDTKAK